MTTEVEVEDKYEKRIDRQDIVLVKHVMLDTKDIELFYRVGIKICLTDMLNIKLNSLEINQFI